MIARNVRPAPTPVAAPAAPVAALSGAGAGNVDDGSHSYKLTFVTAAGETDPSPASNVVTVADKTMDGKVTLTIPVGTDPLTTDRKVYRRVAGDTGAWKLVAAVGNNTATTYVDNLADAGLGANAPTVNGAGGTTMVGGTVLAGAELTANGGADATATIREGSGAGRIVAKLAAKQGQTDRCKIPASYVGQLNVVLTGTPSCLLIEP